jgi:hypothetical protein
MLRALTPLAAALRYGDVRRTDADALTDLLRGLAERATVGLLPATQGLDDAAADALLREIVAATQALRVLVEDVRIDIVDDWWAALRALVVGPETARVIRGTCTRLLLNAEQITADEAEDNLARALARGTPPVDAARWIEGFLRLSPALGGSGLVLATSTRMFGLLDTWLMDLSQDHFSEILPLLRRSTSTFSEGERRQIAHRVRTGRSSALATGSRDLDLARAALVEPIVRQILGDSV